MTDPADVTPRGSVLRPRVWLLNLASGQLDYPRTVTVALERGAVDVPVWDAWYPLDVGGYPAREYRTADSARLTVLQRVALVTLPTTPTRPGAVVIHWCCAPTRLGANAMADAIEAAMPNNVLLRAWGCALDPSGAILASGLDAATGAAATVAKSAWPASWRLPLPTDAPGADPTGARILGAVLA